jgi:hypothetical protein
LATSTIGGLRSGRERKAHVPLSEEDRDPWATPRPCCVGWLADGSLALKIRSAGSQPTAFAKAKYVAPAPPHVRNWRLVNLVPIAKLSPIEMDFSRARFSIQPATCGAPVNKNSPSSSAKHSSRIHRRDVRCSLLKAIWRKGTISPLRVLVLGKLRGSKSHQLVIYPRLFCSNSGGAEGKK